MPATMVKGSANRSPATEGITSTKSKYSTTKSEIVAYAVQCNNCHKWRKLATEDHFEEFRCNQTIDPFVCNKLVGTTCKKPADISYDSSRVWVMDIPNMPKTPKGFKRITTLRSDYSKVDVHYVTPQGTKIRASPGMLVYLQDHPECSHLSPSDFCFSTPKVMRDTVPKHAVKGPASSIKKKQKEL